MARAADFEVRLASPEEDETVARLITEAFGQHPEVYDGSRWMPVEAVRTQLQTGSAFFIAEAEGEAVGACQAWERDGIYWIGALASTRAGAGRALAQAVESTAQDNGIRLVRLECPEELGLEALFERWGYRVVAREQRAAGVGGMLIATTAVTLEKRVRLLTCRPARRGDEQALADLGCDESPQNLTVAVDGDQLVGAVRLQRRDRFEAELSQPRIAPGHRRRRLDLFLATVAARTAAIDGLMCLYARRSEWGDGMVARGWREEGEWYVRDLGNVTVTD